MNNKHKITLQYIITNLSVVVGLVLIWRGIWITFDGLDNLFFGGNHFWSALGGILIGLIILYLPDKDLKEIEKL